MPNPTGRHRVPAVEAQQKRVALVTRRPSLSKDERMVLGAILEGIAGRRGPGDVYHKVRPAWSSLHARGFLERQWGLSAAGYRAIGMVYNEVCMEWEWPGG